MSCSARIGAFAAVSLVLLRLATGWHFFQEGTNKLDDPNWSSAGFLLQAKGPLADAYHRRVPQVHDWRRLLAAPKYAGYIDEERIARHREWEEVYAKDIAEARAAKQPEPFRISQYKPYSRWAQRIVDDWEDTLERFFELPDLSDEEKEQASAALDEARLQLLNYLEEVEPDISAYQHELFRIDQMRKQGSTGELAYHDERIQAKQNEATQMVQPWLAEVTAIEEGYHHDLRRIYRAGQEARKAAGAEAQAEAASENASQAADAQDRSDAPETADGDETAAGSGPAPDATQEAKPPEATTTAEGSSESQREGAPPDPDARTEPAAPNDELQGPDPATTDDSPQQNEEGARANAEEASEETVAAEETAQETAEENPEETVEETSEREAVDDASASEQSAEDEAAAAPEEERLTIDDVLTDSREAELALVDKIVSWSLVVIGACLVVGLFTPVAALGGAIFLAMVISTQPPWVPGTQETYNQFVEMFSLLVLAATCAGRWAGLDYFFTLLFCRRSSEQ